MSLTMALLVFVLVLIAMYIAWKLFLHQLMKRFLLWFHTFVYYYVFAKPLWKGYGVPLRKAMRELDEQLKSDGPGDVVDVGTGFGIILEYLPAGTSLIAVEPSPVMRNYLASEIPKYPDIKVKKILNAFGENMAAIETGSVAAVTVTLLLCSVDNPDAVLKEIKRILKPGGVLIFLEHVHDPEETPRRKIQGLINGLWAVLFGGCELVRDTWVILEKAGFKELQYSFHTCKSGSYVLDTIIAGTARV